MTTAQLFIIVRGTSAIHFVIFVRVARTESRIHRTAPEADCHRIAPRGISGARCLNAHQSPDG